MSDFKYAVVGGAMTGHAEAQGIRSADARGSIAIVGDEPAHPYARPPLSKGLWTGQAEGSIWPPPVERISLRTGSGRSRSSACSAGGSEDVTGARARLAALAQRGIPMDAVTDEVVAEGVDKLAEPLEQLLATIDDRRSQLDAPAAQ